MVGDHPRRTVTLERDGLLVTSITWFREQTDIGGWVEAAACRGADTNLWFPHGRGVTPEAKTARQICHTCSVIDDCRNYAVDNERNWGIWGGLTVKERQTIRRKNRTS